MSTIDVERRATDRVPDLYRRIEAASGNILAVGRPGQRQHIGGVAAIGEDVTAVAGIPYLCGMVAAGRSDTFPIGRPGHRADIIRVSRIGEMLRRRDEM